MKTCNTISNLSLGRNWLILLILCNQKNAALQDVGIWVDIEKCESNQAQRLRAALTGLISFNGANTDRKVMNFQQLLSRSDNKKFSLIIVDL